MNLTNEVLEIAIAKSIEAGLLPRRASKEDLPQTQDMMRLILQPVVEALSASCKNN